MKISNYPVILFFTFAFTLLLFSGTALAHKVNLFAYVESARVYTESYFSDGRPVGGGKIEVYGSHEKLLLEGIADKKGFFNFDVPEIDELNIVIDAGMGHKNSFKLRKIEVEAGQ